MTLAWILFYLPIAVAAVNQLVLRRNPLVPYLATAAAGACFVISLLLLGTTETAGFSWAHVGGLDIEIALKLDHLSTGMMVVVTGVGLLVHVFSLAYMKEDESVNRYFCGLGLFMFSMTGIVLSENFIMMFIFWELVGLSSYLLISHWYHKDSAADAGKKAFLCNRLGDFSFMIGVLLLWGIAGSLTFEGLKVLGDDGGVAAASQACWVPPSSASSAGRSASPPSSRSTSGCPTRWKAPLPLRADPRGDHGGGRCLHVVPPPAFHRCRGFCRIRGHHHRLGRRSHRATLRADGHAAKRHQAHPRLLHLVATRLHDHGRRPAGGRGRHVPPLHPRLVQSPALPRRRSHHLRLPPPAEHLENGRAVRKMPITAASFAAGTAALIAVPYVTSGFWSKEEILAAAYNGNKFLFVIAVAVAFLTAFYMTRAFVVTFLGKPRSDDASHAHEVGPVMWIPLAVLAILAIVSGFGFVSEKLNATRPEHIANTTVLIASIATLVLGVGAGFVLYRGRESDPLSIPLFRERFYFDVIYDNFVVRYFQDAFAAIVHFFDELLINGLLVGGLSRGAASSATSSANSKAANSRPTPSPSASG
jgi:NADH-quinone oxidoreductase subunit L